jgi:elongation factor Ts
MTEAAIDFADECAMQVAAMAPLVVSKDDIPADMLVRQRRIFEAQLEEEKKPAASWQKIIEGKFIKWRKDIVLLEQESIKDSKKTIEQMRQEAGKDVRILRFVRYALGEGLQQTKEDLANEVEKLINNQ